MWKYNIITLVGAVCTGVHDFNDPQQCSLSEWSTPGEECTTPFLWWSQVCHTCVLGLKNIENQVSVRCRTFILWHLMPLFASHIFYLQMCCLPSKLTVFLHRCNELHFYRKHVWWCCHHRNLLTITTKRGTYIQSPSVSLGSSVIPVQPFPPLFLSPDSSWPSLCCARLIFIFQNVYNYHLLCTVLIILCVYIIMFIKIPHTCGAQSFMSFMLSNFPIDETLY
jgi:hypothetical protein